MVVTTGASGSTRAGTGMVEDFDAERVAYLDEHLLGPLAAAFADYEWLQSVAVLITQSCNDEAEDSVYCQLVLSQLDRPDLEAFFFARESWTHESAVDTRGDDWVNLPGDIDAVHYWDLGDELGFGWYETGRAVSLFSPYCVDVVGLEYSDRAVFRPYAIVRRGIGGEDSGVRVEVVGTQLRGWLEGAVRSGGEGGDDA